MCLKLLRFYKVLEKTLLFGKMSSEIAVGKDEGSEDMEKCGGVSTKSLEKSKFCEGVGERWVHHYYVGVSVALFKHLSTTKSV